MKEIQCLVKLIKQKGFILLLIIISSFLGGAVSNWIFNVQPAAQAEEKEYLQMKLRPKTQSNQQMTEVKTVLPPVQKAGGITVPPEGLEFKTQGGKILAKLWDYHGGGGRFTLYNNDGVETISLQNEGIYLRSSWNYPMVYIGYGGNSNDSMGCVRVTRYGNFVSVNGPFLGFMITDERNAMVWSSSK